MDKRAQMLKWLVSRMKLDVMHDVAANVVPRDVESFGDLHDYVDANCYGGLCEYEVSDALIEMFGGRDQDEGMPQDMVDLINEAQGAVNQWIIDGGLR